ncbi:IclR family transcriptional regulator [Egibacter rhizosphaerae]|uniref:IclR family transcriptional regulator n=1 Tax=Egibacter rhizosphaerae TaxID=1670831 RepID=A0A411YBI0_9ACTN|nr:IclR family transcriptional regulator [Egibacter rhizosphaerae]QBI18560.1 IclR family transcriptional regulator [Egibacter rhizosphaerae]
MSTKEHRSPAPAVERAAAILDVLTRHQGGPLGSSSLARELGAPKSSVFNVCNVLADAGVLRRTRSGYALGPKLVEYGTAYLSSIDLVQEFYDVCDQFGDHIEETVQLAILDGLNVIYLARRHGSRPVRLQSEIGRSLPANCTAVGKALLAELSDEGVRARVEASGGLSRLTPKSIAEVEALLGELGQVRARGVAFDEGETADEIFCAATVVDAPGYQGGKAAISFTLVQSLATATQVERVVAQLRGVASELRGRMGGGRE